MNFPCGTVIGCVGVDSPVSNISAEAPDVPRFFKRHFYENSSTICESTVSQAIADLCDPPPPTNPPTLIVYSSSRQSCTLACTDGTSQTYEVAPGRFLGFSQELANRAAHSFACQQAAILCAHGTPVEVFSQAQTCTMECPGSQSITTPSGVVIGGIFRSYTAPAGLFVASTQAEANTLAYQFACVVASLMCAQPPSGGGTTGNGTGDITGGTGGGQGDPVTGDGSGTDAPPTLIWFANSYQVATVTCPLGGTFTFPVEGGVFFRPTRDQADAVAVSYGVTNANRNRVCLGPLSPSACTGDRYSSTITVSPASEVTWSIAGGELPIGMSLEGGVVSGYAVLPGDYTFIVQATLANGSYSSRLYSIHVIEITVSALPDATEDSPYSFTMTQSGGLEPVAWSLIGGTFPAGMDMNSNGEISGTPTESGSFSVTIGLTDAAGYACLKTLGLTVEPAVVSALDWTTLVWDAPTIAVATAAGSSASGTFSGDHFLGQATAGWPVFPPNPGDTYGSGALSNSSLTYTGPEQNCQVELSFSITPDLGTSTFAQVLVVINVDGNPVLAYLNRAVLPQPVTVPFTVPASVGAVITVLASVSANNEDFLMAQAVPLITLTSAVISNVP